VISGLLAAALLRPVDLRGSDEVVSLAERVSQLVRQLGSDEFTVRELATEELAKIGLPAYAALEAAAKHPDREVRYRSRRVLGIIRQFDHERRLEAFLSGTEAGEAPLPSWSRFQRTYGGGPEQRKLFVDMQRADPELLAAFEVNPRSAGDVLAQRMVESQQARQIGPNSLTFAQVAAALFVAAEPDVTVPSQALAGLFSQCFQPAVREALDGVTRREIPRKMLGAIVSRCEGLDAFQAMTVARQFDLPEGIVAAMNILKGQETKRMAPMVQYALITIAKLGDASHLPMVDTPQLLADITPVTQFKENETTYVIQIRDVALATVIRLNKQDLKSFFGPLPNQSLDDPQNVFLNARLIGFASEAERNAVFAKWAKWKAGGK
jgi:hypothetical protein